MKKVTIIGAGLAGLRAASELVESNEFRVVMVEKSPSVGGRVASRRFTGTYVNHGAQRFDGLEKVWAMDPWSKTWIGTDEFLTAATELPKRMRDHLLNFPDRFELKTQWQARHVREGEVVNADGETIESDVIIVTAPIPQAEILWGSAIVDVQYSKCILFIGEREGQSIRIEMDEEWSEKYFEETDEGILRVGEKFLAQNLHDLSVKKWRYARVVRGHDQSFLSLSENVFVAGDAFDPNAEYNLGSAWLSGMTVARHILEKAHA